ncbi:MAG TPA: ROK family protein [Hanamia sp.]|jgi:predicted NBD/HSP70 family sugar kinase|nr:ROK family protein [Hanamia sp.]
MEDKRSAYKRELKKHLYFNRTLSCSDLSVLTNKSLPFVTKSLNDLIADGSVVETGLANSTGGRRAQMFSLKPDLHYIVSVAVDQLNTKIKIFDMHNNAVSETERIEIHLKNNPQSLEQLRNGIVAFISKCKVDINKIIGIGISMPGFVDVKKGINHSFLNSSETDIISYIREKIDLPVLIDNDSSLIALAEMRLGSAHHRKNVMVINIGWGVGLGMILNGELFRGHNGFAGEFSHIPVFKDNQKICSCGKTGCLETETSLFVILQKAITGLQKGRMSVLKDLSLDDPEGSCDSIIGAAARGDTFAVEFFSEAGYNLGLGISILLTLFNPELIILSGRGAAAGKLWLAPIQQAINEHCIPKIAEDTQIKISNLGNKADLIGAAALVMENYDHMAPVKASKLNALRA